MVKKYIVDLSEDEVSQLQTLIKKGKHKARTITRANILLMASEGETDQAMPTAGYAYAAKVQSPCYDSRTDTREICHRWVRFCTS
ncbi:hypothetical protein LC653_38595 [Nostoc sp. CHAB 5784]|uniref:hypothetical protein n=1 Tax=Nostoc mirabile TaxID=2907820 RepID=UPI001E5EA013|nr:hypothetical protein [Nostoc mirabile]MCC5669576.1 hypothetical protein [Nostoc mirabile CHAB5784]